MDGLQNKIYELLCEDMSESRSQEISKVTVEAIEYYQNKTDGKIDLSRNLSNEEINNLIMLMEADPDYKTIFRGHKQQIRWGMKRLANIFSHEENSTKQKKSIISSEEKVMLGINRFRTRRNEPEEDLKDLNKAKEKLGEGTNYSENRIDSKYIEFQDDEQWHYSDDQKLRKAEGIGEIKTCETLKNGSDETNDSGMVLDIPTLSRKLYDVLEKYPDVGLIAEQILDLSGQDYLEAKTITEILKKAKWCRERKKRFYFVPLEDYEDPEVSSEVLNLLESYASDTELDDEAKALMHDPEELLKYLKSKKG